MLDDVIIQKKTLIIISSGLSLKLKGHRGPMRGGPNSDQKFAEIGTRPWPYIVMVGAKLFHAHYYC